ncbi:RolB family protein [Rhizobium rhizogenes]|uniref:RolB family protein n=2 Tax=Rhizobium rhizogenes TaxID=359 RepID=UPI0035AC0B2E
MEARAVSNVVSLLMIKDPNEANLCLQQVAESRRRQNNESLIGDVRRVDDLADKQDASENGDAHSSRKSVRGCPLDVLPPNLILREADKPLLLVYATVEEVKNRAAKGRFKCVTLAGFVACTARPHDRDVTYDWLRKCYNSISNGSCLCQKDVEAYMAFFPNKSFMELKYSAFEVGNYRFFSLPPNSEFVCELVAIGWGFPCYSRENVHKSVASKAPRFLPSCFCGM